MALFISDASGWDKGTGSYSAKDLLDGRKFGVFGRFESPCLARWIAEHFLRQKPNATVVELGAGIGNYALTHIS